VDAGDCTGSNFSGLGTGSNPNGSSAGSNDLSGYGFDQHAPWAVTNSGTGKVVAYLSVFDALPMESIAWAVSGAVNFSQAGGVQLSAPPAMSVERWSDIPPPCTKLADFLQAGGNASMSSGTLLSADHIKNIAPGEYVILRTYTLTGVCGECGRCEQAIAVRESSCSLSVSNCSARGATFYVSGKVGNKYAVLGTTNFLNWVGLRTNTAPFSWVDTSTAAYPYRFYRAQSIP